MIERQGNQLRAENSPLDAVELSVAVSHCGGSV